MVPTFFVIGAPRSGTTSIYEYLSTHPEVFMSPVKEPEFFIRPSLDIAGRRSGTYVGSWLEEPEKSDPIVRAELKQYLALFDRARSEKQRGEASPSYLGHPTAPEHLRSYLPNAKLIAILRDPTERAYSHYLHTKRMYAENGHAPVVGVPGRSVDEEFIRAVDTAYHNGLPEQTRTDPEVWLRSGLYFQHLTRIYSRFPEAQVRVVLFEDLVCDVHALMADLFRFLDVDDSFVVPTTEAFNATVVPHSPGLFSFFTTRNSLMRYGRSLAPAPTRALAARMRNRFLAARKPPLEPELRRKLAAIYRDDVKQLQDLIGRDLSHWLHEDGEPSPLSLHR